MSSFEERHPKLASTGKILGIIATTLAIAWPIVSIYSSLIHEIDRVDDHEERLQALEADVEQLRQELSDEMRKRGLLIENLAALVEEFEEAETPAERRLLVLRLKLEQARMECELSGKSFDSNTFSCNPARPPGSTPVPPSP